MKRKASESNNLLGRAGLYVILGLRAGARRRRLEAFGRGFDSLQVHKFNRPTSGSNHPWGTSSGRSQKDGVSRPAVILAHRLEESKGQNDVPQLQERMPEIWKDPERSATVPLLPMPQDLLWHA